VAGVIAAADNDLGVMGVAPNARLWAVKVLNRFGAGRFAVIIDGIDWVAESWTHPEREPIEVINMSLAGPGEDDGNCGYTNNDPLHQAICNVVDLGVTVVVAAGNEAEDSAFHVPAAYDEVITVSAIDDADDSFASFSNYGADVDITAPGVDILSTALQPWFLGQYSGLSGTSFSSPHVAGAAALFIRSYIDTNGFAPTPAEVRAGLIAAGEPAPASGWPGDSDNIDEPLVDAESL
jgi:subtilisin family serine protease